MSIERNAENYREQKHDHNSFLEQLLYIDVRDMRMALSRTAMLLIQEFDADKVDVFLYDPAEQALIAIGVSETPMGRLQQQLGLDRLRIDHGGNTAKVYQTGVSLRCNAVKEDPDELPAIKDCLGVASAIATPLVVGGQRRGVVQVDSYHANFFTEKDLAFLEGVVHWVSIIVEHAELVEQQRRSAVEEGHRLAAEELMTILAHDLRNYLTPLKLRIDFLQRRAIQEQRTQEVESFQAMKRAVDRVEGLIEDVMDTSRLSHGLFTLSCEEVNLLPFINEAILPFQQTGIDIVVGASQDIRLFVDTRRLLQALDNLLANAVKHSPPGGTIEVTARLLSEENSIEIAIKDQGQGIPDELLPHIFQPFSSGPRSSGLGIGLYLAHQIAWAHGGQLTVDKAYKQGACFLLKLPLRPPIELN